MTHPMWHTITSVAQSRRLDARALEKFARQEKDVYAIVEDGQLEVSTWHVDDFVRDFKAFAQAYPVDAKVSQAIPSRPDPTMPNSSNSNPSRANAFTEGRAALPNPSPTKASSTKQPCTNSSPTNPSLSKL